jgi:uncharacterized protein (DUF1330 family)
VVSIEPLRAWRRGQTEVLRVKGFAHPSQKAVSVPAYIVVKTDIRDPEQYELYKQASARRRGGRRRAFHSTRGELVVLEGDWRPKRLVLLEFPDLEAAKRFYESSQYQEAKRLRDGAADFTMVAVDGVA